MSTSNNPDPTYTLRLFNEKAEELNGSRFLQSIRDGKGTYTIHWERGVEPLVKHDFPHPEESSGISSDPLPPYDYLDINQEMCVSPCPARI
jgi:hypothetical protein